MYPQGERGDRRPVVVTTEAFVRQARIVPPRMPAGELVISSPPDVPRPVGANLLLKLLPVVMVIAVIGMVALMFATGGRQMMSNPLFMMFPMMMVMSMVGMFAAGGRGNGGKRGAELNEERKDYFRYLGQIRTQVRETGDQQRRALLWSHPDPRSVLDLVGTRRMWERRPADTDFAHVRIGVGSQRLATRLVPPETGPVEDLEPVSMVALRRFVRTHAVVHRLPTAVSLRGFPAVAIEGVRQETRGLVRAMIIGLALAHGPEHLRIAVVTADPGGEAWDWAKWLPHVGHPTETDVFGPERMIYPTLTALEEALSADLDARGRFSRSAPPAAGVPQLLVILDDGFVTGTERLTEDSGIDGVTLVDLSDSMTPVAARRGLQLVLAAEDLSARSSAGIERFAHADSLGVAEAEMIARAMARYRLSSVLSLIDLEADAEATDPGLTSLLGIADATRFDPRTQWRSRQGRERLRVPVGFAPDGTAVELDIKESAHGGMGPHGLCVGATGSGKSEFLRTLVLSMIATHSPTDLNLVLVDFKGGATFLGLERTPHVAAVITNLEQELSMVDRMKDALSGEMNRRQELLRAAGNFANVGDYERARSTRPELPPMPALFIIVDEFSELLSQKPDFADLFVAIGRLGRSLHIHLLLASQRLDEGRLRGLDSHLSYRIGLKTFSANESRSVLGVPDAYHLPSRPGSGFLKCDSAEPVRFNSCYVSGPYQPPTADPLEADRFVGVTGAMRFFTAESVPALDEPTALTPAVTPEPIPSGPSEPISSGPSLLETIVDRISGHGPRAHEVWLPPLDRSPSLDQLGVPGPGQDANLPGTLRFPIGLIDRPYEQRRDPLVVDVSGGAGNVAVVGAPQSGKSTTLRTMIMSAAATHTPEQVQFYCLDFGGGALAGLTALPHVGGVCGRGDMDGVRRTVAEVSSVLRLREALFARHAVESMSDYRLRRRSFTDAQASADDPFAEDRHGDVFLVLDGAAVLRGELEALDDQFTEIVSQGLSYGVHVIVTASRWAEIRPGIKDLVGTRIELRLGDPMESEMGRRVATSVPQSRPGRGITSQELHMLIALPRSDASSNTADLGAAMSAAAADISGRYPGRQAPPVRRLRTSVSTVEVAAALATHDRTLSPGQVAIGLGESDLAPVVLDFSAQPHLVAFADVEHGKTTLLTTLIDGLTAGASADQAKIVVVDYRRTLLGVVDEEHLGGYASSAQKAGPMLAELAVFLQQRLPPEDVTPAQLRDRSWWHGPEVYLVIDDYDMVSTASMNPVAPLIDLLPSARDIGLRVILTHRSGGAGRALFDPVIGRLKELSCDLLLMSGDRDEGFIAGRTRMAPLVPGRGELVSRLRPQEMVQIAVSR